MIIKPKTFKLNSPLNINILANSQKSLSNKFAGKLEDRWKGVDYDISKNKVPFFKNSLGIIEAKVFQKMLAGDHTILLCKITNHYNLNQRNHLSIIKVNIKLFKFAAYMYSLKNLMLKMKLF